MPVTSTNIGLCPIPTNLGTIRIPSGPQPVFEHFRWHGCISGRWSSCANARVVLEPLVEDFLAREATLHVCALENANRSIRVPPAAKPDGVGVSTVPVTSPSL